MTWKRFFGGRSQVIETPLPVPAFNYEQRLIDELHMIDERRDEIGEAIRDFRSRSTAIVDGKMMYQCQTVDGRAELDAVWNALLSADSKLLQSRNAVLRDLAALRCPFIA